MVADSVENYNKRQAGWIKGQQPEEGASRISTMIERQKQQQQEGSLLEEELELDIKLKLAVVQEWQDKIRARCTTAKDEAKSAGDATMNVIAKEDAKKGGCDTEMCKG